MSKFNYYNAAASTYAQARWMDVDRTYALTVESNYGLKIKGVYRAILCVSQLNRQRLTARSISTFATC